MSDDDERQPLDLATFIAERGAQLVGMIVAVTGCSYHDAEDAAQYAIVRALEVDPRVATLDHLFHWAKTVGANQVRDLRKHRSRTVVTRTPPPLSLDLS